MSLNSDADADYYRLLRAIQALPPGGGRAELMDACGWHQPGKYHSAVKTLSDKLLLLLGIYSRGHSLDDRLREALRQVELFHSRGFYHEALLELVRTERMARRHELYSGLLQILETKRRLYLDLYSGARLGRELQTLQQEATTVLSRYSHLQTLDRIFYHLVNVMRAADGNDVQPSLDEADSLLLHTNPHPDSLGIRLYRDSCLALLHYLRQDYEQAEAIQLQLLKLVEAPTGRLLEVSYFELIFRIYVYYLSTCQHLGRLPAIATYLNEAEALLQRNQLANPSYQSMQRVLLSYRADYYLATHNLTDMGRLLPELTHAIENDEMTLLSGHLLYNLSSYHMQAGQFTLALRVHFQLINDYKDKLPGYVYAGVLLQRLVALAETEEPGSLSHYLRSAERYMRTLLPPYRQLLQLLQPRLLGQPTRHAAELATLRQDKTIALLFQQFDYAAWAVGRE